MTSSSNSQSAKVMFIGKYDYPPHEDAVRWTAGHIMAAVWRHFPEARFIACGNGMKADSRATRPNRPTALANCCATQRACVPWARPAADTSTPTTIDPCLRMASSAPTAPCRRRSHRPGALPQRRSASGQASTLFRTEGSACTLPVRSEQRRGDGRKADRQAAAREVHAAMAALTGRVDATPDRLRCLLRRPVQCAVSHLRRSPRPGRPGRPASTARQTRRLRQRRLRPGQVVYLPRAGRGLPSPGGEGQALRQRLRLRRVLTDA